MHKTDIAIIGGGMLGCATAWFLAKSGQKNVTLFERNTLAAATTSRGAGMFNRARPRVGERQMIRDTQAELAILEDINGDSVGYSQSGSLTFAKAENHRAASKTLVDACIAEGDNFDFVDANFAREQCPWLDIGDDHQIAYCPDDGFIDPYRLATAYAAAAKAHGVTIKQGVEVTGIDIQGDKVQGVETTDGNWQADIVIDAAGPWAAILAQQAGLSLPLAPVRSHYWITEPVGVTEKMFPVCILADARAYARYEVGSMLLGIRDAVSASVSPLDLPRELSGFSFDDDFDGWNALEAGIDPLLAYSPFLGDTPIRHYVSGPSAYTLDGAFVMGQVADIDGLLVAGGCCGAGIAHSSGFGQTMAALVNNTTPKWDITPYAPDRFGSFDPLTTEFATKCAASRSTKTAA